MKEYLHTIPEGKAIYIKMMIEITDMEENK